MPNETITEQPRYLEPGWFTHRIFNRLVRALARHGVSIRGSAELRVRGRSTGEWRSVPVNPLTFDGSRYLVAPRGTTQWVRNIRAAGGGELRVGRKVDAVGVVEIADADKPEILRAYLRLWKWEVGTFFDGIDADADDQTLLAIAAGYPVFRLTPSA